MARSHLRVVFQPGAVRSLLRGPEIVAVLAGMASAIAAAAGPGHESSVEIGPNRARAEVHTATFAARRDEARRRTLTTALGRGRR